MAALGSLLASLCLFVAVAASAQVVNCSSNDMGRHSCPANTSNGVRLARQISGSPCIAGQTWGYESASIWVDRGCRADFALNAGTLPAGSALDSMRSCKNAVSAQRPNVPLAYIQVDQPRTNGGSQLVPFRVQPPGGPRAEGSCDVFQNGRTNVVFGASGGGGGNGGNYGGISPQDAQLTCKNSASQRLPGVPLAYISTYRGTDTGDGNYMINFRSQPPGRPTSSGFCIITKRGQLQRFNFDRGSGQASPAPPPGNGIDPHNAALLCKNGVSAQWPNVPLAYIQVDPPRVNGGSLLSTFRVRPPGKAASSGSCDVFRNGKVNIQYNR